MKISRILQIAAILCCFAFSASAQNISVASFKMDEMDLTANQQGTIVLDQNGEKCALIKVINPNAGFTFDVGSLGVMKIEQHTNETWVYVPAGIRRMTINHPQLGQLRDYQLPVNIERARTYVMELKTEKPKPADQQKLTIKCLQQGALVSIDGQMINLVNGTADITLPLGNHTFIAMASGYYQQSGTIELVASHPGKLTIDFDPDGSKQVPLSTVLSEPDNRQTATPPAVVSRPDKVGTYSVVGNIHTVNGVSFKMVLVEGGTFSMGATPEMKKPWTDEKPVPSVTLSSYSIGETEVTQELWRAVMGNNPSYFKGDQNPVENVSWRDCQEFISRLNKITGKKFRLPTEAEWEFAARGGNRSQHTQYSGSDNLYKVAWYKNSSVKTHPVKQKQANELGLYDMSGNVWEWCNDWFGSYSSNAQTNPTGPTSGSGRVYRGGSIGSPARECRCSCRNYKAPDFRSIILGLRLALSE